jgi:hypothetical protein
LDSNSLSIHRHLTILKHFPKTMAAEHEATLRVEQAAIELGWDVSILEVDNDLDPDQIRDLEAKHGLVLDLHFQFPKFLKGNSIGALWTPVQFMSDWGLAEKWANQLSHDLICVTGEGSVVEIMRLYRASDHSFPILNHTLPGSWLIPSNAQSGDGAIRAFYAGIGWDRFNNRPGRHQKIFKHLDTLDVLDLYGPSNIQGLKPWAEFKSYRGSIPFDGRSILETANKSGAMLVWSSPHHVTANIMSNRLFEALAARCVVIGDEHPVIREVLGDSAFYVNMTKTEENIADQVLEIVTFLSTNPEVVKELTDKGAEVFLRDFDLTQQLKSVFASSRPKSIVENAVAIIFGENQNMDLKDQLLSFGVEESIEVAYVPRSIEEVIRTVSGLTDQDAIILTSDVELMDNFATRINVLKKTMEDQNAGIGVLTFIATFRNGRFAPTIIEKSGSSIIPLLGLLIKRNSNALMIETAPIDPIVSLRVPKWELVKLVELPVDALKILKRSLAPSEPTELGTMGVRNQVQVEVNKLAQNSSQLVVDMLISSGRTARRRMLLSLLATIPGSKPFRKILRPVANYFIRHSE